MCRSKYVQPSINFGIINSITKLHVVGISTEGGYTLVTLPRIVTQNRDSVDGSRDRVTYQKLVTR